MPPPKVDAVPSRVYTRRWGCGQLDGITLRAVVLEIADLLPLKIQKIYQPSSRELEMQIWGSGTRGILEIDISPTNPFLGLVTQKSQSPASPPAFCQWARKHLEGGLIHSLKQHRSDRIVFLELEGHDEFGSRVPYRLLIKFAGKDANVGVYRGESLESSILPPAEEWVSQYGAEDFPSGKPLDLYELESEEAAESLLIRYAETHPGEPWSSILGNCVEGVGKDALSWFLEASGIAQNQPYSPQGLKQISRVLMDVSTMLKNKSYRTCLFLKHDKEPLLHVLPLNLLTVATFDTALEGARAYWEYVTSLREYCSILDKTRSLLARTTKKVESRYSAQVSDYERAEDCEKYRLWSELLRSSGLSLPAGQNSVTVLNYYLDPPSDVEIPLDPKYSLQENARLYMAKFVKLSRARKILKNSIEDLEKFLSELDSLKSELQADHDAEELKVIFEKARSLAERAGIAVQVEKRADKDRPISRPKQSSPSVSSYKDACGNEYFVGENSRGNDYIARRLRRRGDLWFHVRGYRGAHVLLRPAQGQVLDSQAIQNAAMIAAARSEARSAAKVEVDCVDAAALKTPPGAPQGFVVFTGQTTYVVEPRNPQDLGLLPSGSYKVRQG